MNINKQLANSVNMTDSTSLKSCKEIASNKTNIAHIPPSFTISSLCLLQPKVNAISDVGNIKYIKLSWNSWDVKNVNSTYGANIRNIGNNMQCTAQAADIVKPKLSNILCMEINISIYTIKASFS
mgnify:CR=1 FL=1